MEREKRFGCAGIVRRDHPAEMLTGETNALFLRMLTLLLLMEQESDSVMLGSSGGHAHRKSSTLLQRLLTLLRREIDSDSIASGSSGGNADRRKKHAASATADITTTYGARVALESSVGVVRADRSYDERLIRIRLHRDRLAEMLTGERSTLLLLMLTLLLLIEQERYSVTPGSSGGHAHMKSSTLLQRLL